MILVTKPMLSGSGNLMKPFFKNERPTGSQVFTAGAPEYAFLAKNIVLIDPESCLTLDPCFCVNVI